VASDWARGELRPGNSRVTPRPAKLKAMISVTATVVRGGVAREIPIRQLVRGDIVQLCAGDLIPGDVRVVSARDFVCNSGHTDG